MAYTYDDEVDGKKVRVVVQPSVFDRIILNRKSSKNKYKHLIKETDKKLQGKSGTSEALNFANKKNIKIIEKKLPNDAGGYYSKDGKTIVVNKNMPEGEKFWTVTHELEHLKHKDHKKDMNPRNISNRLSLNETRRELATERKVKRWLGGRQKEYNESDSLKKNENLLGVIA
jgi:hypothetical protein